MDTQLSRCLKDIEIIHKELDANLVLLAKNVDDGYGQLRKINKQCSKYAKELEKSNQTGMGMVVQLAGFAITGVAGAYNAAKAASAHNEALRKLLAQKVKIANEKYDGISKIKRLAQKNEKTLSDLFTKHLEQSYSEHDLLDNTDNTQGIISEIKRVGDIYKLAKFNMMMINYLLKEYDAWRNYQQKSEERRPVMSFVNNDISELLFNRRKKKGFKLNLQSVISRDGSGGKITGAELLFLTDSSITGCILLDKMIQADEIVDLGVKPAGIAEELIGENTAFEEYESSLSAYNGWWHGPAFLALVLAGLSVWFDSTCWGWMSEWWAVFRWMATLVLVIVEFIIIGFACKPLFDDETKKERLDGILNNAIQKQLDEVGYVEIYEPDLEEKNVLWEGAKGLFKGIFS